MRKYLQNIRFEDPCQMVVFDLAVLNLRFLSPQIYLIFEADTRMPL
jgi:hypothetical protein